MAFGQPSGPPASAKQVRELLDLLVAAGHADFRDARGPMQFTQRQAAGKFTRDEADLYISRLQAEAEAETETETGTKADMEAETEVKDRSSVPPGREPSVPPVAPRRPTSSVKSPSLAGVASEVLAAELQSRGWVVLEP